MQLEPKDTLNYEFKRETIIKNATSDTTHGKSCKVKQDRGTKMSSQANGIAIKNKITLFTRD